MSFEGLTLRHLLYLYLAGFSADPFFNAYNRETAG